MAHIEYSENGNSPLQRLLGHNQEVLSRKILLITTFESFPYAYAKFTDHPY